MVGCFTQKRAPTTDDLLENRFLDPPTNVKPYVWWHWMGPNFSKEGITKDLEAMKDAGIGGATIFNITSSVQESHAPMLNNPWPEQTFRSPAYWEAIKFAAAEGERLGLEIGLHNTPGYATTGGPWIDEERSMQQIVWSETSIVGGKKVSIVLKKPELPVTLDWGSPKRRATLYEDIAVMAVPAGKTIMLKETVDLTGKMDESGNLEWEAPQGDWTICRIGYAPTMADPHPLPDDIMGISYEVNKINAAQNKFHWETVLNPLKEHLGPYLGKSFKHILIDSYEARQQNWTEGFREEFIKRKGYDPVPWITTFSPLIIHGWQGRVKRVMESEDATRRFEWDYQDVIHQLYFENGWNIAKELTHEANLELQFEPYTGPFSIPQGAAMADLPMGEFWTFSKGEINQLVPAAARAAGKTIVGAESFTGEPELSKWTEDPAFLKLSADGAFADGVNRLILHHWVHQPFDDKYQPGLSMGWWGTHFNRHQTWFEPGKTFFIYLGRCQALLQYGEQYSDYLCMDRPEGFSDVISKDDFLSTRLKVKKGKIILPSGRSYAFIVFPDEGEMLPEVARKIKDIVSRGATVVSVKPGKSPSLRDYPACDAEVKKIADELWGNGLQNKYKKGFVFTRLEDAIKKQEIQPDFFIEEAVNPEDIKIVHRYSSDVDIYFIANQSPKPQNISVSFFISGKQPELWQAEDGAIANAPVWSEKDGRTTVDLQLKGTQSLFVVFRKAASGSDHPVSVSVHDTTADWNVQTNKEGLPVLRSSDSLSAVISYDSGKQETVTFDPPGEIEMPGAWRVSFAPKLGQPFELEFDELIDFSGHRHEKVKYFSGTATYQKEVIINDLKSDHRVLLDLGIMNDIAEVKVNGQNIGVLWYPPYKIDVTDALKIGENELKIAVTNTWANRLIGDEQEPADFEWGPDRGNRGRGLKAYPDWFINNQPRPSQGRKTFTIWHYYREDSPLQPAGLVGPVRLQYQSEKQL
jgi:hypothetical protein